MRRIQLRDESGIALIMALGIMLVMSLTLASLIQFTSANAGSANRQNADQQAYALAEAGFNNALSVLYDAYEDGRSFWDPGELLPPRTSTYDGRTVTWRGVYCFGSVTADCTSMDYAVWKIFSTGTVANPTGPGAAPVRRTVVARIPAVLPPSSPPATDLWNWVYSGAQAYDDTTCTMTIRNTVQVKSPLYVEGNLCIDNQVRVADPGTGQDSRLVVGNRFFLMKNHNYAGCIHPTSGSYVTACAPDLSSPLRLREARIVNGCVSKSAGDVLHLPCRGPRTGVSDALADGASSLFVKPGGFFTSLPDPPVRAPTPNNPDPALNVDLDGVYKYAHPGPLHPCSVVSGTPPTFDNNAPNRDNSVPTVQNLTPSVSYTCRTVAGELSWNHLTRVLTVTGPLYIDGSAKIEASGNVLASYTGRSALYVSGTFLIKNTDMCALRNSAGTACDFQGWNPNEGSALAIAAFGNGSNGAPQSQVTNGAGIQLVSSRFQGLLYATSNIVIDTTSHAQGPMVSPEVIVPGQSGDIYFPPVTIVPTYTPGTPPPAARLGDVEDFG